ncbi:Oidioi.mRNA.OKI2018_I69.XSR.g16018.t1.cds [Oikopleura dioica]|uniref:Oidioi.mRNA.OKI2018_I69.XSR.g16018.t1.cds n=1 Tax=Oikopleura dioica TaxID=34765 RepID=A0ABN7SL30_OIKDI|nr:Oidioi.mRNA.OKI2018_I69.XSR.g16018.t1.cds [Oikopleura dioica]
MKLLCLLASIGVCSGGVCNEHNCKSCFNVVAASLSEEKPKLWYACKRLINTRYCCSSYFQGENLLFATCDSQDGCSCPIVGARKDIKEVF